MPLYDYKCLQCEEVTEVLIGSADDSGVSCPACGNLMRRQVSAPSFRLKGNGWYETDFKSDNKRNLAGDKGAASAGDGGKKADAKTDKASDKSAGSTAARTAKPASSAAGTAD